MISIHFTYQLCSSLDNSGVTKSGENQLFISTCIYLNNYQNDAFCPMAGGK